MEKYIYTLAIFIICNIILKKATASNILMITMGGTKSHKIPFMSLGKGLIKNGHNVTLLSAFPNERMSHTLLSSHTIEEITPINFVLYVKNFTDWDILGPKLRGEEPVPIIDIFSYGYKACEALLSDPETEQLLTRRFDLLILDGAYPECALGLVHHYGVPFMYFNTVAFYTQTISFAGNPSLYSVTPYFGLPYSDTMTLSERIRNTFWHLTLATIHFIMVRGFLESILRNHLGATVTPPYLLSRNVSFILQNGHAILTYPRPYLPNVAEVACIHCTTSKPLPTELDEFVRGGRGNGFIYVSMGSSVKAANMPEFLRQMFINVFSHLPYQVVWKYEADPLSIPDLPDNVYLGRWLPQQDLLGHEKIVAFVNHGGLLSLFEAVYHAVPVITLPVFCDQESNSAKAVRDGYAIRVELKDITSDLLLAAIKRIINDSSSSSPGSAAVAGPAWDRSGRTASARPSKDDTASQDDQRWSMLNNVETAAWASFKDYIFP
ncbi:UDP-glucosyltransferase 2-like isoform X2 [Lycorma delicatula]|uniref:UDP-glucosyltransferase 2-like isoform X2 n=1 Tax=Lycorma delicatula TaxID=130591 RepID=UPI003F50E880